MKTTFNSVDINFQSWHVGLNKTHYHRSHHAENLPQTRISFRRSANNLHIATGEDLDLEQARAILNLMRCHSNDCNKFFIDVRHVTRIQPAAAAALRGAPQPSIAPQRIHYKGSRGFELATSGNKVLIVPEKAKHVCKGTCPNCRCKDKKARAKARNTARAAVASGGAAVA